MTRWTLALAIALWIGSTGCQSGFADDAAGADPTAACRNLCGCQTALPTLLDQCIDDCRVNAAGLSSACLRCASEVSCLAVDDCDPLCGPGDAGDDLSLLTAP